MTITSLQNETIRAVTLLHTRKGRDMQGQILVEGPHAIQQALAVGLICRHFFAADDFQSEHLSAAQLAALPLTAVSDKVLAKLGTTDSVPGCVAVFEKPEVLPDWKSLMPLSSARWIYLDGVQDPGNLGTLIRSAAAFGLSGVLLGQGTVDAWNPKVIRSSVGAVFAFPVLPVPDDALKTLNDNWQVLAAVGHGNAVDYRAVAWTAPLVLLLGNEGAGLRECWLNHPTVTRITIPMSDRVESLNVAVSGSILMAAMQGGSENR